MSLIFFPEKLMKQSTGRVRRRLAGSEQISFYCFVICLLRVVEYFSWGSWLKALSLFRQNYLIEHVRHVIATKDRRPSELTLMFWNSNRLWRWCGNQEVKRLQENRKMSHEATLASDKPSVFLNCANFLSFSDCREENCSNDLNFQQIYLSRESARDFPSPRFPRLKIIARNWLLLRLSAFSLAAETKTNSKQF